MKKLSTQQLSVETRLAVLQKLTCLPTLSAKNLAQFTEHVEAMSVNKGEMLVSQGDAESGCFVLYQGQAVLMRKDSRGPQIYDKLQIGNSFGSLSIIAQQTPPLSLVMASEGVLLHLSKSLFLQCIMPHYRWTEISYAQAKASISQKQARWLDVRGKSEYDAGHLAGSLHLAWVYLHISLSRLQRLVRRFDPKQTYIVYSNQTQRAQAAALRLQEQGVKAYVLEGGLNAVPATALQLRPTDAGLQQQVSNARKAAKLRQLEQETETVEHNTEEQALNHTASLLAQVETEARRLDKTQQEREQLEKRLHFEQQQRIEEVQRRFEEKKSAERRELHQLFKAQLRAQLQDLQTDADQQLAEQRQLLGERLEQEKLERQQREQALEKARIRAATEANLLKVQRDAARAVADQQKADKQLLAKASKTKIVQYVPWVLGGFTLILLTFAVLTIGLWPVINGYEEDARHVYQTPASRSKTIISDASEAKSEAKHVEEDKKAILQHFTALAYYQDRLRNNQYGPLMAKLPAGRFIMGSPPAKPYPTEHPPTLIKLKSFSISIHEITFDDYRLFAHDTGFKLPDDRGWGQRRRPVINVSWEEAVAYTQWLSEQTGKTYRLPSEREWEYAASAGARSHYWWGNKIIEGYANCASCGNQLGGISTAIVGRFKENGFGLHDVLGNVMEWVLECKHPNYQDMPQQGHIWEGGDCTLRGVRGGSYRTYKRDLRLTRRAFYSPKARSDELGFRVVQID